jgi:hypothetical protein
MNGHQNYHYRFTNTFPGSADTARGAAMVCVTQTTWYLFK